MRRRQALVLTTMCVVLATVCGFAAEPEWPGWLGPNRDGKSPDTGLLKEWPAGGPKLLWKNDSLGNSYSTIAVSGDRIYTIGDVGNECVLFALDMDGKVVWKKNVGQAWTGDRPGARSTPTLDNGKLYVMTGNGLLVCYEAKDGTKVWSKEMKDFGGRPHNWGYAESPLICENAVIVTPGGKKAIVALDKSDGKTIWTSSGFDAVAHYGSCIAVTVDKTTMIVAGTGSGIFAVNAKDGTKLWENGFSKGNVANCPSPAYADGYVFWANGYGKGGICLKVTAADGKVTAKQEWTTRDMDCHHGGYIIDKGCVYGNNGGGWACLDLKTGQKKWTDKGVGKGSLCYADGMLYLFNENGQAGLATCSPDGLQMKGTFKVTGSGPSWAHPVVIGGRLYLRYGTNLYCFDVKAK